MAGSCPVLMVSASGSPVQDVPGVSAGRRQDEQPGRTQEFGAGDRCELEIVGRVVGGVHAAFERCGDGKESVGNQGGAAPSVPGGPGGDLALVQARWTATWHKPTPPREPEYWLAAATASPVSSAISTASPSSSARSRVPTARSWCSSTTSQMPCNITTARPGPTRTCCSTEASAPCPVTAGSSTATSGDRKSTRLNSSHLGI